MRFRGLFGGSAPAEIPRGFRRARRPFGSIMQHPLPPPSDVSETIIRSLKRNGYGLVARPQWLKGCGSRARCRPTAWWQMSRNRNLAATGLLLAGGKVVSVMDNALALTVVQPTCLEAIRELPEDLRRCLGTKRLLQFAFDAVQIVVTSAGVFAAAGEFNPRMLLSLLTYCYGSGIGGSEDVEWAAATDSTARYICAGQLPTCLGIRRFRRENRQMLKQCLAHTLAAACAWNLSPHSGVAQWDDSASRNGVQDADGAGEIRQRVQRILERAIQFDTSASE